MKKQTQKAREIEPVEKPLYEARYELTSLMTQEAASLITPTGTTNPAYILVYGCLGALLLYALVGELAHIELNVPVMLVLAFAIAGLLYVAQRWPERMRRKLAEEDLDAVLLPEDQRNFIVNVYEDRVDVDRSGQQATYELAGLRNARLGELVTVLTFPEGDVIVPKKALSASRYNQFQDFFRARSGGRQRRKGAVHA